MVAGQGYPQDGPCNDLPADAHGLLVNTSHGEDGGLGGIDDGGEGFNPEHAEIGDREGALPGTCQFPCTGLFNDLAGLRGKPREIIPLGSQHDGHHQAFIITDRDSQVDVFRVLDVVISNPAVHPGFVHQGQGAGSQDEIIDGYPYAGFGQGALQRQRFPDINGNRRLEVGNGALGILQSLGDGSPHSIKRHL